MKKRTLLKAIDESLYQNIIGNMNFETSGKRSSLSKIQNTVDWARNNPNKVKARNRKYMEKNKLAIQLYQLLLSEVDGNEGMAIGMYQQLMYYFRKEEELSK